jgi:pyridoxine 5'-phosphate synthase PdxJ
VNCNDYHALSGRVCKEIVRKLSEMKTNYKFIVNCVMVPENVDNMTTALGLSIRCTDDLMFSVTEEMACGGIMIITIAGQLQQHFTQDTKCLTWAV